MKKSILVAALIIIACVVWPRHRRGDDSPGADRGQSTIFNRVWVDHLPRNETERFKVFIAVTEHPFGHFAERSVWRGEWEAFRHESRGDGQLELLFPHDNEKQRVSYRAWKCNEPHFEYCLELTGGKGAKKYYSQRGWETHDLAGLDARIEAIAAQLHLSP